MAQKRINGWWMDFRPAYRKACSIVSFLTSVPTLVLTATATVKDYQEISRILALAPDIQIIRKLPDRYIQIVSHTTCCWNANSDVQRILNNNWLKNLFSNERLLNLIVIGLIIHPYVTAWNNSGLVQGTTLLFQNSNIYNHVVEQYDEVLSWILDEVKEKGTDAKKIILYTPSINTCQKIYNWMAGEIGTNLRCPHPHHETKLVEMFHSHTTTSKAKSILNDLTTIGGCLKSCCFHCCSRPWGWYSWRGSGCELGTSKLFVILAGSWTVCQGWPEGPCSVVLL